MAGLLRVLCLGLLSVYASGQRVQRIGNEIRSSSSGVDIGGTIFLINDIILQEGVLFAFRAYFRSDMAIRFQIWRPMNDANSTVESFQLISETPVIPSLINDIEDIYLVSKFTDCSTVSGGDRLGLYFEESPGAVAYVFDATDPTAYGKTVNVSDPTPLGGALEFDALTFPYDFSVAAYIDTEGVYDDADGDGQVTCPENLLIPDYDFVDDHTPEPPVTGAPGATGYTGPEGQQGATGFTGPAGINGLAGVMGATGPQGTMGATGASGMDGYNGTHGAQGPAGATGPQGPQGEQGEQGPEGPAGPAGPPGEVIYADDENREGNALPVTQEESFMSSNLFLYILLGWLVLLTLAFLILVIVISVTRRRRRDREPKHSDLDNVSSLGNVESDPPKSEPDEDHLSWLGTMKTSSDISYSNTTLNTRDMQRRDPLDSPRAYDNIAIDVDDSLNVTPTHSQIGLRDSEIKNY